MTAVFWIFTLLSCAYAAWFGRKDGRCASLMIIIAVILTAVAQNLETDWSRTHVPVMLIDFLFWAGLIGLMLRSRAWWPIWMAASQTLTLATHLATWTISDFRQEAYVSLGTFWSIPCLLSMVLGVLADGREHARRRTSLAKPN